MITTNNNHNSHDKRTRARRQCDGTFDSLAAFSLHSWLASKLNGKETKNAAHRIGNLARRFCRLGVLAFRMVDAKPENAGSAMVGKRLAGRDSIHLSSGHSVSLGMPSRCFSRACRCRASRLFTIIICLLNLPRRTRRARRMKFSTRMHEAQLLTYMKLSGIKTGLLMNFNVRKLK